MERLLMELVRGAESVKVMMSAIECKLDAEIAKETLEDKLMHKILSSINIARYFCVGYHIDN